MFNFRKHRLIGYLLLMFLSGVAVGWLIGLRTGAAGLAEAARGKEIRLGGYELINPLLECDVANDPAIFRELQPFTRKLEQLLREKTRSYKLEAVSVYFRDLNDGPYFTLNNDWTFEPASLLKVATMIACLKQAEQQPGFLAKRVVFTSAEDYTREQRIKPAQAVKRGGSYTVDELLRFSIVYSDNNADELLIGTVDPNILYATYHSLGVGLPLGKQKQDYLHITTYATFFRVLFNASYLNKEMSQKALFLLEQSEFRSGIVAGVPQSVPVAHKFGESVFGGGKEIKELHDCGIVYYPGSPYMLCIMSRGADFIVLDDVIRDVSRAVFEEVDLQHRRS